MKKGNRFFLSTLFILYLVGVVFHIWLFYAKGWASIFSSFFLYLTVGLIALKVVDLISNKVQNENSLINIRLFVVTTLIFLFAGELTLRYICKIGLSYKEKNGHFFYVSPFVSNQKFLSKNHYLIHPPNTDKKRNRPEFSYDDHFNSLGLRERETTDILSDSQAIRILGLGDSFTEGTGTHQDSTWLRILENHLKQEYPDKKIVTINGGTSGSDPIFEYNKLKYLLLPLNPNLVILSINNSDIFDISVRGGFDRHKKEASLEKQPWWEPFFASSLIVRGISHVVFGYNLDLLDPYEQEKYFQEAKQTIIDAVNRFKKLSKDNGFILILLIHPMKEEVINGESNLRNVYNYFEDDKDIYSLNLLDSFLKTAKMNSDNVHEYYWELDGHHTPEGYKLWAKNLNDFLVEQKLIENL